MINKEVKNICKYVLAYVKELTKDNNSIASDMGGACAIGSYILYRILKKKSYDAEFILLESYICHCFVRLNGFILDITVKQFETFEKELPNILIIKENRYFKHVPELKKCYLDNKTFSNRNALNKIKSWDDQSPFYYKNKINNTIRSINNLNFST